MNVIDLYYSFVLHFVVKKNKIPRYFTLMPLVAHIESTLALGIRVSGDGSGSSRSMFLHI